ncbi:DUF222 domain-containing protein, partial [Mycolicibacterium sp.]
MFDEQVSRPRQLTVPGDPSDMSDAALIDAITECGRITAMVQAAQYRALAEWDLRNTRKPVWENAACDDIDHGAASISCALTIGHLRAIRLMRIGVALRDRFPGLGRLLATGQVSDRVVSRVVWLTEFVTDPTVLARLDEAFVKAATYWGALSAEHLDVAVEAWIDHFDPEAVRRVRARLKGRGFSIGKRDDQAGTVSVYGKLGITDGALLAERLDLMINGVCENDPRTKAQRRADALGALSAGKLVLACRCEGSECPASDVDDGRASSLLVHVITDHDPDDPGSTDPGPGGPDGPDGRSGPEGSIHGPTGDPYDDESFDDESFDDDEPATGDEPADADADQAESRSTAAQATQSTRPEQLRDSQYFHAESTAALADTADDSLNGSDPDTREVAAPQPVATAATKPRCAGIAYIPGMRGAIMPGALLADLIGRGAKIRHVAAAGSLSTSPGYRPSTAMAEFVRTRDLTCR